MASLGLLAVALAATPASAQLQIHAAVTADAPGETAGMSRQSVATAPDREVWVGPVVLDVPPTSIQTVGLELDADGATALSLWLSSEAAAAFAALTEASVGRALAVVWDGRVLTAPVVQSPIRNGMVMITGLDAGEAERLADALREVTEDPAGASPVSPAAQTMPARPSLRAPSGWSAAPDPAQPSGIPERPPLQLDPPPGMPPSEASPRAPVSASPTTPAPVSPALTSPAPSASASVAAQSFAAAVARRDWRSVAAALHPDAVRAIRADASRQLRLDGAAVRIQAGGREGSFAAADVLGRAPQSFADLDDLDMAALYLAGLDALGAWPPPDPSQEVVAEVPDGRRVYVLLRGAAEAPGVSEARVVTLALDDHGAWRPLLTHSHAL